MTTERTYLEHWLTKNKLSHRGHTVTVRIDAGWGEPPEYQALCSCGWKSYQYLDSTNTAIFQDSYKKFIDKWGWPVYSSLSKTASAPSGLKQTVGLALLHLDYPWGAVAVKAENKLKSVKEELLEALLQQDHERLLARGSAFSEDVEELYLTAEETAASYARAFEVPKLVAAVQAETTAAIPQAAYKEYKKLTGGQK